MSYASAARSGAHAQETFYNANLLMCFAAQISYEKLAEALHQNGYWDAVNILQRVDFNRRYAVFLDNGAKRDKLLNEALNIDGIHVSFARHQKKVEPRWKVFVSQLPGGKTKDEIHSVLRDFGQVKDIQPITRMLYGKCIDTGDRIAFSLN